MTETVLAYIEKGDSYLMLYRNKKENDMNEGFYMGVGGHIEERESPEDALLREVREETSLTVLSYQKRGMLYFKNDDYEECIHLYTVDSYEGEVSECDEGTLSFIKKEDIFSLPQWEGDKIFMRYLLSDVPYFELELTYKGREFISYRRLK